MLEQLKETVCKDNKALPKNGLVLWTSGNVSAKDSETEYVVIKPSGIHFDDLTPESMIVVDLKGNVIEGDLTPSVDTESHLYVYNHCPEVLGITHTHSPYATAFSIAGESLPIQLLLLPFLAKRFRCQKSLLSARKPSVPRLFVVTKKPIVPQFY